MALQWKREHPEFTTVLYDKAEGIAKIAMNRPEKMNGANSTMTKEMEQAFLDAWHDNEVGVVVVTGTGKAFCTGGDVSERDGETGRYKGVQWNGVMTMVHYLIRNIPKPVIAMVNGYAIGGGQVIQQLCDLSIASDKAVFGQVGPKFGSFDAGLGGGSLARYVGEKKAKEIWFLCRRYTAQQALEMGLVNAVVPEDKLEEETVKWAKEMLEMSPTALKLLKYSMNAQTDHLYGFERLGLGMIKMFYSMEEGREGGNAFLERRKPNHAKFRKNV